MKTIILTALLITSFTSSVLAGPQITTSVERVRVRPAVAYVKLQGCPKFNRIFLDTEYGKAMFSSALAAASAGKTVRVEFTDSDGCETIESTFEYFEIDYRD